MIVEFIKLHPNVIPPAPYAIKRGGRMPIDEVKEPTVDLRYYHEEGKSQLVQAGHVVALHTGLRAVPPRGWGLQLHLSGRLLLNGCMLVDSPSIIDHNEEIIVFVRRFEGAHLVRQGDPIAEARLCQITYFTPAVRPD